MNANFSATRWSVVLQARAEAECEPGEALASLCARYWHPLYAFLRYDGHSRERAEDLTQGFFTRLIEKRALQHADPERGRFRSFLITSLRNYVANEHDHDAALKRGGGRPAVSLDVSEGESRIDWADDRAKDPGRAYERAWALELLEIVVRRAADECAAKGKAEEFAILRRFLTADGEAGSYETAAAELGSTREALRQSVHRLRKRFRELLRAEVALTVSSDDEIDDEIRDLFSALAS